MARCSLNQKEKKYHNQQKASQENNPCCILIKILSSRQLLIFKFKHAVGGCIISNCILGAVGLENLRFWIRHQKRFQSAGYTGQLELPVQVALALLHPAGCISETTTVTQLQHTSSKGKFILDLSFPPHFSASCSPTAWFLSPFSPQCLYLTMSGSNLLISQWENHCPGLRCLLDLLPPSQGATRCFQAGGL